jgi:hypothetical protein
MQYAICRKYAVIRMEKKFWILTIHSPSAINPFNEAVFGIKPIV